MLAEELQSSAQVLFARRNFPLGHMVQLVVVPKQVSQEAWQLRQVFELKISPGAQVRQLVNEVQVGQVAGHLAQTLDGVVY